MVLLHDVCSINIQIDLHNGDVSLKNYLGVGGVSLVFAKRYAEALKPAYT